MLGFFSPDQVAVSTGQNIDQSNLVFKLCFLHQLKVEMVLRIGLSLNLYRVVA